METRLLNHLAVIHELIKAGSYHQLSQYVSEQRESLPQSFPIVSTGHPVIDAILTNKYAIAQSEHISFMYSVILPEHFPINDIEITGDFRQSPRQFNRGLYQDRTKDGYPSSNQCFS